jgi:hypothetical protein
MEYKLGGNPPRVCPSCGSTDQETDQAKERAYCDGFYGPVAGLVMDLITEVSAKPKMAWERVDSWTTQVTDKTDLPHVDAQTSGPEPYVLWRLIVRAGELQGRAVELIVRGKATSEKGAQLGAELAIKDARQAMKLALGGK